MDTDRVGIAEAARTAERSTSTIRRWTRDGTLTRHEGPQPDHGGSAPILISRAELLGYLVEIGQQPRATVEPQGSPSRVRDLEHRLAVAEARAELAGLRAERDGLARELDRTRADLVDVRAQLRDARDATEAARSEARATADALREAEVGRAMAEAAAATARGQADVAEAARRRAEAAAAVPIWRRLLGMNPAPALTGPEDSRVQTGA